MKRIPLVTIEVFLTKEQVKQMEGGTKILNRMAKKKKPGAFLCQVWNTNNKVDKVNIAFGTAPKMKCYIIPNYLMKRLMRLVDKAMYPANKIPRRNYWKAAATGIIKYIKGSKVKRNPRPPIDEEYDRREKYFQELDDDIPF